MSEQIIRATAYGDIETVKKLKEENDVNSREKADGRKEIVAILEQLGAKT